MKKGWLWALLWLPFMASAHSGAHDGGGFLAGFNHPVLGLDHLLAMLSVGIISAQRGGRAIWQVPLTFVAVMLIGGVIGMAGLPFPSVELGIACSVLLLGLAIFVQPRLPIAAIMAVVAFFALFHGHAHGVEMPSLASPLLYMAGFVVGTAMIHIAGVLIALGVPNLRWGEPLLRFSGMAIAAMGVHFILA